MKEQLSLVEIKNNVAWFASNTSEFTADLPAKYEFNDKVFNFKKGDNIFWCHDEEYGYHVVSNQDSKFLTLMLEETDIGFEIAGIYIFNVVQTH